MSTNLYFFTRAKDDAEINWIYDRPLIKHPESMSRIIRTRPRSDFLNKDTRMWNILEYSFKHCPLKDFDINNENNFFISLTNWRN